MSEENNSDEVPVNVVSENEGDNSGEGTEIGQKDMEELLELERRRAKEYEAKLKLALADFQNLNRKTASDIENGVNLKIDEFVLEFLKIYDDFGRAKQVFSEKQIDTKGLDSILKNMDSLLKRYNVTPIEALGETFNPNYHEAIAIIPDSVLDDGTITKEIRKGYICQKRVIRPTLVEISKKGE